MTASRAMRRLQAACAGAGSPREAARCEAELAALLAQRGDFDEAHAHLESARRVQALEPEAPLQAWICLAEGLIEHYSRQLPSARDRLRRAHALAVSARSRALIARCAAWLAYIAYVYGDLPGLARHLAEALQESSADQHAARARAHLVAAQAHHWCGRLDLAQPFYERSRRHALAEGDDGTLSALMANRVLTLGAQLHLAAIFGPEAPSAQSLGEALTGTESARAMSDLIGRRSLRSITPLVRAQLLSVSGRHADALALYEAHLPQSAADGYDYLAPVCLAETAWCRLQLGQREAASEAVRLAEQSFVDDCEDEDRARAHGRLAQVNDALGLVDDAERHRLQAHASLAELRQKQSRLLQLLGDALKQVPELG